MRKGQLSTELMILIGGLVLVSLVLFYYGGKQINETHKISKAEDAVSHLVEKVNEIASLTTGSKDSVWIDIPSKVLDVRLLGNYISLVLLLSNGEQYIMTKATLAQVVGQVNFTTGLQQLYVTKINDTTVKIGTEPLLLEIIPQCISEEVVVTENPVVTLLGADLTPSSQPFADITALTSYSYKNTATLALPSNRIYGVTGTFPSLISVQTPPNYASNSLCFHIYAAEETCACLPGIGEEGGEL